MSRHYQTRLIFVLAAIALATTGQSQSVAASATVQGFVRDPRGVPVAAATVYLQVKDGPQTFTTRTDSSGTYLFSALGEGTYNLRVEMTGYNATTYGPFVLGPKDTKEIGLTLQSPKVSNEKQLPAGAPEFYDEPKFTVAGVTDATNPGGHGADTILRTTEGLTKAAVALGGSSSQVKPNDSDDGYQLPLARADAGKYETARAEIRSLLAHQQPSLVATAELHHRLGDIEEKLGEPLEAVREYQRAAQLDPSESNLFDWGGELLVHRALEPATEVFAKGNRLFPGSARMLIGLGVAWYARGSYDQAAQRLCEASDLNPSDPRPYLFLGKMQSVGIAHSEEAVERLERFLRLQPENALANYYYALGLSKERSQDAGEQAHVHALLVKAVGLDPKLGVGYLQLGILYAEGKDIPNAISSYEQAIAANPDLSEAHYRLAQAYTRTGEKLKAQKELELYEQTTKNAAEKAERERREIRQFVYTLRGAASEPQPK